MPGFLRLVTICFSIALFFVGCREEKRAGEVPTVSLSTYSGETFTISPRDQKVSLIVFWATWCRPCLMEIPTLVRLQDKYRDRNFRVISINIDDPEGSKTRAIIEHFGINYTVLSGSDEITHKFGGVYGIPTAFLIGHDGLIKDKIEGMAPEEMLDEKITAEL